MALSLKSTIFCIILILSYQQCNSYQLSTNKPTFRCKNTKLGMSKDPIINLNDMAYTRDNILRQAQTYLSIRRASKNNLQEICNDVYVHDIDTDLFWYVGKSARCSTTSIQFAIARQFNLIEEHAARLRPVELGRKVGQMEIWVAPVDSELNVANGELDLQKMERIIDGEDIDAVSPFEVGFNCEYVTDEGEGFHVKRKT